MTKIEILNQYKKQKRNTYRECDVINAMEKYLESYKQEQALQLQQTGVMRSALNQEEAFKIFTQHNKHDGFIQWKGTDVCMDFQCECGHHNHYDDYFAYVIKCSECGSLYAPSSNVEMIKINEANNFIESNF